MKSTGIRRKVDDLGRIVIPAGIRRSLGIREGDQLDVSVDGDHVVLSKPIDRCVFCRSQDGLRTYEGKAVCADCASAVADLAGTTDARPAAEQVAPRTPTPVPDHVDHVAPTRLPDRGPVPAWAAHDDGDGREPPASTAW